MGVVPPAALGPEPSVEHRRGFRVMPWPGSRGRARPSRPGIPATLATRRASWFLGVLERFWLRCLPPVERVLRRWTSVALKKATMKGCLFWGPCRPIRPANLGLMLCPRREAVKGTGEAVSGDASLTVHPRPHHSSITSVPTPEGFRSLEHSGYHREETPWALGVHAGGEGGQQTHGADRPGDTCACRQGRGGTRVCRTGCCSTHFSLATSGHVIYLSPRGGGSPAWCQGGWEQAALGTAAFCTEGPSEQRAGWQGGREPLDVRGEGAPGRGHHKSWRWKWGCSRSSGETDCTLGERLRVRRGVGTVGGPKQRRVLWTLAGSLPPLFPGLNSVPQVHGHPESQDV